MYSIQHYLIKFVIDLQLFLGTPVSSTKKTLPRYNWYIVESDVKHHKPQTDQPTSFKIVTIKYYFGCIINMDLKLFLLGRQLYAIVFIYIIFLMLLNILLVRYTYTNIHTRKLLIFVTWYFEFIKTHLECNFHNILYYQYLCFFIGKNICPGGILTFPPPPKSIFPHLQYMHMYIKLLLRILFCAVCYTMLAIIPTQHS